MFGSSWILLPWKHGEGHNIKFLLPLTLPLYIKTKHPPLYVLFIFLTEDSSSIVTWYLLPTPWVTPLSCVPLVQPRPSRGDRVTLRYLRRPFSEHTTRTCVTPQEEVDPSLLGPPVVNDGPVLVGSPILDFSGLWGLRLRPSPSFSFKTA